MNKKAQGATIGFALLVVLFMIILVAFATIDPLKEALDNNRGTSSLNCPGTPGFNSTNYTSQTAFEKQVRRPTCFATGIYMFVFVGSILLAGVSWVYRNFRRVSPKR
jgi:hypothetical protein